MADISKIKLNDVEYDIKDVVARDAIVEASSLQELKFVIDLDDQTDEAGMVDSFKFALAFMLETSSLTIESVKNLKLVIDKVRYKNELIPSSTVLSLLKSANVDNKDVVWVMKLNDNNMVFSTHFLGNDGIFFAIGTYVFTNFILSPDSEETLALQALPSSIYWHDLYSNFTDDLIVSDSSFNELWGFLEDPVDGDPFTDRNGLQAIQKIYYNNHLFVPISYSIDEVDEESPTYNKSITYVGINNVDGSIEVLTLYNNDRQGTLISYPPGITEHELFSDITKTTANDIEWRSGVRYKMSTGELETINGRNTLGKFILENAKYKIYDKSGEYLHYADLVEFDEDGNHLITSETNTTASSILFCANPKHWYAINLNDTHNLPENIVIEKQTENSDAKQFSIMLNGDTEFKFGSMVYVDVTDLIIEAMPSAKSSTLNSLIDRCNYDLGLWTGGSGNSWYSNNHISYTLSYWGGSTCQLYIGNLSSIAEAVEYFTNNPTEIIFNGTSITKSPTLKDYLKNSDVLSDKYDKTGGPIDGNVKINGNLTIDIEDEDYDAGIYTTTTLDNDAGPILSLTGYAGANGNNTLYRPVIRNIANPVRNSDVATKQYVDNSLVSSHYHLVILNADGTIDTKASSIIYSEIRNRLTNQSSADYLDVTWQTVRFQAKFDLNTDLNAGYLRAMADIWYNDVNYRFVFTLNNENTLWSNVLVLAPVALSGNYADLTNKPSERAFYSKDADDMQKVPTTETAYFTHTIQNGGDYLISYYLCGSYDAASTVDRTVRHYIKKNSDTILHKGRFTTMASHKVSGSASFYAPLSAGDIITFSAYGEKDNVTPYGIWFLSIAQI